MAAQNHDNQQPDWLTFPRVIFVLQTVLIALSLVWLASEISAGFSSAAIEPLVALIGVGLATIAFGIAYYRDIREEQRWTETNQDAVWLGELGQDDNVEAEENTESSILTAYSLAEAFAEMEKMVQAFDKLQRAQIKIPLPEDTVLEPAIEDIEETG